MHMPNPILLGDKPEVIQAKLAQGMPGMLEMLDITP
jgi:hypothetical protein